MQNAKDTFYITLRDRLATLNPAMTISLRAVTRPAIIVEEAEAPSALSLEETYILRWTSTSVDTRFATSLTTLTCHILYATSGSQERSGLDRGRAMSSLDSTLLAILSPNRAPKMNFTVEPALQLNTTVFWGTPAFQPLITVREHLQRIAEISLFSFCEEGDQ